MRVAIHQPEFAPWLGFFHKVSLADRLILLDDVPFRKNYFQNRNRIRLEDALRWLTIPVEHPGLSTKICDVGIAWTANPAWIKRVEALVRRAYRDAPYAKLIDGFVQLLSGTGERLVSVNVPVIRWMLEHFSLAPQILLSSSLPTTGTGSRRILDLCLACGADTYVSGVSGRDYLDLESFRRSGIQVEFQHFLHPVYPQQGPGFIPQVSALEALLLLGPAAPQLLKTQWIHRLETVFT
jgi:hypothetical protein